MAAARAIAISAIALSALAGAPAHAEDQRTSDQHATTVKFVSKIANASADKQVKAIAKMLGVRVSHPSSKVWVIKAKPSQIQTFQRMLGGFGLTIQSNK